MIEQEAKEKTTIELIHCGCGGKLYLDFAKSWDPEKEEWIPNSWHRVICKKCGTQTIAFYTEAIQAWNTAMGTRDKLSRVATDTNVGDKERTAKVEDITEYCDSKYGCCPCGKGVHDKFNYCPHCGARLEWK